jgi:hypothetical protein
MLLQRARHTGDDDTTTVVAPHDIHCNAHNPRKISSFEFLTLSRPKPCGAILSAAQNSKLKTQNFTRPL